MWLVASSCGLPSTGATGACAPVTSKPQPRPAYTACPLSDLPPVFAEPELATLFAGLAPGQSLEVTEMFLRVAAPWPYLDIRGPGAAGGGDMPNEPRAVFLLRPAQTAAEGPLLLVAPARLQHQLQPAAGDGLPRDSWRISAGPYAPTLYGRLRKGRKLVGFTAHPSTDPMAGGVVKADQRAALVGQIIDFFVNE